MLDASGNGKHTASHLTINKWPGHVRWHPVPTTPKIRYIKTASQVPLPNEFLKKL